MENGYSAVGYCGVPFPFDNLFSDAVLKPRSRAKGFSVDVEETSEGYVLSADLPGVSKDLVDISLEGSQLTIAVKAPETSADESRKALHRERRPIVSVRKFELPKEVSQEVEASLRDGVLTLYLKKDEAKSPKKIAIN